MKKIIPLSIFVLLIGCGYNSMEECELREAQKFKGDITPTAYEYIYGYCLELGFSRFD